MSEQDYIRISNKILENGTSWQKKCIKWFMKNSVLPVSGDMRFYIDNLIKHGQIEV